MYNIKLLSFYVGHHFYLKYGANLAPYNPSVFDNFLGHYTVTLKNCNLSVLTDTSMNQSSCSFEHACVN